MREEREGRENWRERGERGPLQGPSRLCCQTLIVAREAETLLSRGEEGRELDTNIQMYSEK